MEQLQQELKDLISKNLPAQVGENLKERLELLSRLEKENKFLNQELDSLKNNYQLLNENYNNCISKLQGFISRELEIIQKEEDLFKKTKEMELREIRVLNEITRKECAEKMVGDLKDVIGVVFQNTTLKKSILETQGGTWGWDSATCKNVFFPDGSKTINTTETNN